MTIDDLHAKMEAEFKVMRTDMQTEFEVDRTEIQGVRSEIQGVRTETRMQVDRLEARITTEGETTRRHFDIVAEQFKDYIKVLADGIGLNTERLDDHEKRISTLERRGS